MAGIRMTGLISNMDTESIVESMMDAHRIKLTKIENKKTKLEWKQDKWKDLNTKLYKLYQEQTSKLHLTSNYKTKKVTSGNESVVKVSADKNASEGTHSIIVKQLASSQYVTGGKLDSGVKGTTSLKDINPSLVGNKITIETSKGQTTIDITDKTTINDFTRACTNAGLNASYDEKQNRFFISSASSGLEQGFTLTSSDYSSNSGMLQAKNEIISLVGSANSSAVYKALNDIEATMGKIGDGSETTKKNFVSDVLAGNITKDSINADTTLTKDEKSLRISMLENIESIAKATVSQADTNLKADITTAETKAIKQEIMDKMKNSEDGFYEKTITVDGEEKTLRVEIPRASDLVDKTDEEISELVDTAMASADMKELLDNNVSSKYESQKDANQLVAYGKLSSSLENYVSGTGATPSNALDLLGVGNITKAADGSYKSDYSGSKVISAADSIVEYNGVELTGSSNSIKVNGLTFEAISLSEKDINNNYKATSITVTKDTQGMYDMVKQFVTQYNTILKEMNDLYYADSARGYNPLTDEEKEAMTDEQIKLWEDKIKNSSLRRDTTLGGISSAMKEAMSSTVVVDGKKYSLSSFGITTAKDYTEKGLLHIYGDKEDSTYADKSDKLMKAIEEDPETFAKVMAGITDNLHTALNKKMSKTSLSSALTFYNDKQIDNQVTQYKKDMTKLEAKLKEKEAAYYKQFTAMEKALASLQEQQSALSGLLGSN
ncbi:MAG: flagellar filament capping protein FliD [Clostridiales bacterium]|nr:flagellar filament capping protein FliD [Clostridiales bacterium]